MKNILNLFFVISSFTCISNCVYAGGKKKKQIPEAISQASFENRLRKYGMNGFLSKFPFSPSAKQNLIQTKNFEEFHSFFHEAMLETLKNGLFLSTQSFGRYDGEFVKKAQLCAIQAKNFNIAKFNILQEMETECGSEKTAIEDFTFKVEQEITTYYSNLLTQLECTASSNSWKVRGINSTEENIVHNTYNDMRILWLLSMHKQKQDLIMEKRTILIKHLSLAFTLLKKQVCNLRNALPPKIFDFLEETHKYTYSKIEEILNQFKTMNRYQSELFLEKLKDWMSEFVQKMRKKIRKKNAKLSNIKELEKNSSLGVKELEKNSSLGIEELNAKISNMTVSKSEDSEKSYSSERSYSEISDKTDWNNEIEALNKELDFFLHEEHPSKTQKMIEEITAHCFQKESLREGFIPVFSKNSAKVERLMGHVSKHLIPSEIYTMMQEGGGIVPKNALQQLQAIPSFKEYLDNPDTPYCSSYILPIGVEQHEFFAEFFTTVNNIKEHEKSFTATTASYPAIEFAKVEGESGIELRYKKYISTLLRGCHKTFYPVLD